MPSQTPLKTVFYIYKYPATCHRYWDPDSHIDSDTDHGHDIRLYCEQCGRACTRIGSFPVSPFDPDSFPDSENLPLKPAADDAGRDRRVVP